MAILPHPGALAALILNHEGSSSIPWRMYHMGQGLVSVDLGWTDSGCLMGVSPWPPFAY